MKNWITTRTGVNLKYTHEINLYLLFYQIFLTVNPDFINSNANKIQTIDNTHFTKKYMLVHARGII